MGTLVILFYHAVLAVCFSHAEAKSSSKGACHLALSHCLPIRQCYELRCFVGVHSGGVCRLGFDVFSLPSLEAWQITNIKLCLTNRYSVFILFLVQDLHLIFAQDPGRDGLTRGLNLNWLGYFGIEYSLVQNSPATFCKNAGKTVIHKMAEEGWRADITALA